MKLLAFLVLLFFAACATSPVLPDQAVPVPSGRIYLFETPSPDRTAQLVIVRDVGWVGGGCYKGIFLNEEKAARLDTGERVNFYLPPGEWFVRVGQDPDGLALCGVQQQFWIQKKVQLAPHEVRQFRLALYPHLELSELMQE